MDELLERMDFWTHGPNFLKCPFSEWPKQPSPVDKSLDESKDSEIDLGSKEEVELYFAQIKAMKFEASVANQAQAMAVQESTHQDDLGLGGLLERCSSLQTIRGVITRIKRLAQKARGQQLSQSPPSHEEVEYADMLLASFTQQKHLSKEIAAFKNDDKLPKGSVLKDLPVYYDKDDQIKAKQIAHSCFTSV